MTEQEKEKELEKYIRYLEEAESLENRLKNGFRGRRTNRKNQLEDLRTRLIPRQMSIVTKLLEK